MLRKQHNRPFLKNSGKILAIHLLFYVENREKGVDRNLKQLLMSLAKDIRLGLKQLRKRDLMMMRRVHLHLF